MERPSQIIAQARIESLAIISNDSNLYLVPVQEWCFSREFSVKAVGQVASAASYLALIDGSFPFQINSMGQFGADKTIKAHAGFSGFYCKFTMDFRRNPDHELPAKCLGG